MGNYVLFKKYIRKEPRGFINFTSIHFQLTAKTYVAQVLYSVQAKIQSPNLLSFNVRGVILCKPKFKVPKIFYVFIFMGGGGGVLCKLKIKVPNFLGFYFRNGGGILCKSRLKVPKSSKFSFIGEGVFWDSLDLKSSQLFILGEGYSIPLKPKVPTSLTIFIGGILYQLLAEYGIL